MSERTNPLIKKNGVAVGRSYEIDFVEGSGVSLTVTASDQSSTVTIAATGGPGGSGVAVKEDNASVATATTLDFGLGFDTSEAPPGEVNVSMDLTEVTVITGVSFAGNVV